jgi:hypothetical protein
MNTKTLLAMSLFAAGTLGGCSHHQSLTRSHTFQSAEPTIVIAMDETVNDTELVTIWGQILNELFEQSTPVESAQSSSPTMPALVAGDWLAFECALAGGYWDVPKNNDAPVFAEAPESWFPTE